MTEDKQTGARAAAKAIVLKIWYPMENPDLPENRKWIEQKVDQFEAIILKHWPQDKAVGLVDALHHAIGAIRSLPDNIFGMNDNGCAGPERQEWPIKDELLHELQAALAEHERAQG